MMPKLNYCLLILMHEIEAEDVYGNFYRNKELFDLGNYLEESNYCDKTKNLGVGKMKDETCSFKKFCRIKSKNFYSYYRR